MFFWEDWYTYAIVGVVALIVLIAFFRNYVKVPPNVALIVSGRRHKYKVKDESGRDVVKVFGYRIVRGGATFIIPFFERVDKLNLGIMQVDIKTTQPVPSQEYIGMMVDGVANIKIGSDDVSVATAAEQFLGWKQADIAAVAMQVLEGNMREIVGRMRLEEMVSDRQKFADLVKENAEPDLAAMGLDVVSFNVQNFTDSNGVIDDLGIDNISQIKKKAAIAKAVEERTKIVEKAEALASSLDDEINWRSTADKFRSLFDQWQQHQRTSVHIDKPQADALWKRFSAARTTFNQARRKWSQARDVERAHAKAEKEAIIAEANQLKDSTAWGETSRRFNELMDRWKRAGRVGRSDDDALWAQFRKAADEFFNARQADRDQISTSEKENLAKKEELLKKAEALVPVADEAAAKKARQALGAIQDEWDQIGYVPRDDMRRIEGRLDAVDKQIKAVEDAAWKKTDPEADARKSSFEEQLTAQLAELDEKIAAESDPKKKAKLEAEKATKEQWLNAIK